MPTCAENSTRSNYLVRRRASAAPRGKPSFVIKNDGYWPLRDTFPLTTVQNEQYYDSLDKYVKSEDFAVNNNDHVDRSGVVVADEELFQHEEIAIVVKSCPNGKTCGIDGVPYEDFKVVWDKHRDSLADLFKILKNLKLSDHWKHSGIQRIPKRILMLMIGQPCGTASFI